jgi:hypothetical protein
MPHRSFKTLASAAILTAAPLAAQAEMVEMSNRELADVSGQGALPIPFFGVPGEDDGLFPNPLDFVQAVNRTVIIGSALDVGANTVGAVISAPLEPIVTAITAPFTVANEAVGTAANVFFSPITLPLRAVNSTIGDASDQINFTASNVLLMPLDAVLRPINRGARSVRGRSQAVMDGIIYSVNETTGPLITGTFVGASILADNLGLNFTSRTMYRIAQAQDGRTRMRQDAIAVRNGIPVKDPAYLNALEASFLLRAGRDDGLSF